MVESVIDFLTRAGSLSLGFSGLLLYYDGVSNSAFGFRNLFGPQIFPVLKYKLNRKDTLLAYIKFAPIISLGLTLNNREIAGGIGYIHVLKNRHPLLINLDVADFKFGITNIPIRAISGSLSVGYGF